MSRYLRFNKPYHVLPSESDPDWERGVAAAPRATLADFVPMEGLFAAGRLDYDSEGLMLLTDDGTLAHRVTHPHFEHPKTYWVQVEGEPDEQALAALRRGGLRIKDYLTAPATVRRLLDEPVLWPRVPPVQERPHVSTPWLEIILTEGKKRQVRRMTAAVGHPTLRLVRVAIGPLRLGTLAPGSWQEASAEEVAALRAMVRSRRGKG